MAMSIQKPVDFYLIRGLARESVHWGDFTDQLKKEKFVQNVICLELPGTGEYFNQQAPLTIKKNAEFCLDKIKESESEKIILSISLGSMVALEMARIKPNLFKKVIVMNTSLGNLSPLHHRLQMKALNRFYNIIKTKSLIERELECLKMVSHQKEKWPELSERFALAAAKRPVKNMNFLRQLYAAATYRASKEKPNSSILILSSMCDEMVNPECSLKLSEHWGAPLYSHPTAGHDIPIDAPDWVIKILRENLA